MRIEIFNNLSILNSRFVKNQAFDSAGALEFINGQNLSIKNS
jgi:hypothetical protein